MSRFTRVGAALTGAGAILVAAAIPATADPATGTVDPEKNVIGYQVNVGGDWLGTIPTSLIGFTLTDGTTLGMYCVEIQTEIDDEHPMVERPWEDYPNAESPFNKNRAKINWVLHHGFPTTNLEDLAKALPEPPNDGIDVLEAIAATQAAVWHFSDGVDLNRDDPLSGDASDDEDAEDALALYDYLIGEANTGIGEAPIPTLKIDPAKRDGKTGTKIGPFKVDTTATVEKLTTDLPGGVRLTDADGNKAEKIENGTELFVDVPADTADGDGSFELTASTIVETGRLFVGENYEKAATQSLIVAKSEKTTIKASAAASWSAAPVTETTTTTTEAVPTTTVAPTTTSAAPVPQASSGDLAETGASVFTPIAIGAVLVAAGVGALLFMRRRRT
ncbi:thioester domain-containing protein [Actinophytocola sp.]|uniref:thioester domain-containing protein n=1 Tax=Actinophytocola sp. TaxID=1872138 RepID=UPI002ED60583